MTRKRIDGHSTEFGLWLREQEEIDSSLGFVTTNIDFLWQNYRTGYWCLIEEKRYGAGIHPSQAGMFKILHDSCCGNDKYCGFHIIVFEKTSPTDGWIRLNGNLVGEAGLLTFLKFQNIERMKKEGFANFVNLTPYFLDYQRNV